MEMWQWWWRWRETLKKRGGAGGGKQLTCGGEKKLRVGLVWGRCGVDVGSMYGRCGHGWKLKIKSKI